MKVCNNCETVFGEVNSCFCPVRGCGGNVIDIDENLFEAYKILNEKDYCTNYCCSAHSCEAKDEYWCVNTYISFEEAYDFAELPVGFEFGEGDKTVIRKRYKNGLTSVQLQKQIWKTAKDVLEWAVDLRPNY